MSVLYLHAGLADRPRPPAASQPAAQLLEALEVTSAAAAGAGAAAADYCQCWLVAAGVGLSE